MDALDLETDSIDLKLDEENELVFEVSIQGEGVTRPIYRLVCEANCMSLAFNGEASGNQVRVVVPALDKQLSEGVRSAHLEVIADNRIFVPIQLSMNFSVSTKVVVESVKVVGAAPKSKGLEGVTAKVVSTPVQQNVAPKAGPPAVPVKVTRTLAEVYDSQNGKKKPVATKFKTPTSADLLRGLLGKRSI